MDTLGFHQPALYNAGFATFCFPRSRRLLSAADYKIVFDQNDFRASHKKVLVLAKENNKKETRLGLVFGKKNIPRSVDRNRLKRITREQFRLRKKPDKSLDIIVIARNHLAELDSSTYATLIYNLIEDLEQQQIRKEKNDL